MARRASEQQLVTTSEMLEKLAEGIKQQALRPNIYAYRPHTKQYRFHTSPKHIRLYIGGNRSGKTVGGATEMAYWLMKKHPYRKIPLPEGPVRMRGVSVDFKYGVDQIMLPELTRWIPPSYYKGGSFEDSYDKTHQTLTLSNKSFIEFRSYEQDLEKFAGTSRHGTWFDEEPPQHIYNECMARHVDTDGYTWITMTPVEGMTWVYESLYIPGIEGSEDVDVIEIETTENSHLSPAAIERFLRGLDPEERKARKRGEFVAFGGRVFKTFHETDHVIEPIDPRSLSEWEFYTSFDHGFNNPTAILWHAVSPKNEVITFHEHYAAEMTVKEHAKVFHAYNESIGREPDFVVGDPAMHQRSAIKGTSIVQEYAENGIYIAEANNDVSTGVNIMHQYLRCDEGPPKWHITENCANLIKEMKKLRWKTAQSRKLQFQNNKKEEIHKKDDHACDSARYFFSFMPDLRPAEKPDEAEELMQRIQKHSALLGAGTPVYPASADNGYKQTRVGEWHELVKPSDGNEIWDYEILEF